MSLTLWEFILSHTENEEKWFWTLAGGDVILPLTRSMGWRCAHGDNNGFRAIPFNDLYSCSHVPIGKSAQLSNTGKPLHWLLPRSRWAYQTKEWVHDYCLPFWGRSAQETGLFSTQSLSFFWKTHLKQASGRSGRLSPPCVLTSGAWQLWKAAISPSPRWVSFSSAAQDSPLGGSSRSLDFKGTVGSLLTWVQAMFCN